VGIYVHKQERGYHNYAAPYSWDVRLGHKQRDAARDELNDRINIDNVQRILREIGYEPEQPLQAPSDKYLVAWYVAEREITEDELRAKIADQLPAEFVPRQFVRIDAMPLTHNGKVDRKALPRPGLTRPETVGEYVAPEGTVENQLSALWSEILGVEKIGTNDSFFDLGGDSILNIQIVARAKQLGIAITPQNIFDYPTIRELAKAAGMQTGATAEQDIVTGPVPLTPIQHRFFERTAGGAPEHLSQAVLLSATTQIDPLKLEMAWREVVQHHDALRASFKRAGESWEQLIGMPEPTRTEVRQHDLGHVDRADIDDAIDDIASAMNGEIDIADGALSRVALLQFSESRPPQVLVVIHHLIVDAVSWWILLQDLETVYDQLSDKHDVHLPLKTSSIRQWSTDLQHYAEMTRVHRAADFWSGDDATEEFPVDFHDGANDRSSARSVTIELDRDYTTRLVRDVPAAFRVQVPEVLLAAFGRSARAQSSSALRIDLEGHGREEIAPGIDLLRTVGWFTSIYPVDLPNDPDNTPERALAATKERLRSVPTRGLDYGVLRYLHPDAGMRKQLRNRQSADVLFNYLGHWDQTLAPSSRFTFARPIMAIRDPDGARDYVLEIDAVVFDDVLRINMTYSENLHQAATIEEFARRFHAELRLLIDASSKDGSAALAPSDFPTADLDQSELDELLAEFGDSE
jgi:non-ribosomal peptide synthase protein (TIGR01720 family)